jgi:hypothetical protein
MELFAFLMKLHLHWYYFNIWQEVFSSFTVFTISFGKTDVTWSQVGAVWWMIQGTKKERKLRPLLIISSQRFCKPRQMVIQISRYATLLDHQSTQFQSAASHAVRGLQLRFTSFRLTCPRFTSRTRTAEHWTTLCLHSRCQKQLPYALDWQSVELSV